MMNRIRQDATLWDIYTRREEYSHEPGFVFGRFGEGGFANKEIRFPVISNALAEEGFSPEYPDGKRCAICLTHDIDDIYPPRSHILSSTVRCFRNGDAEGLSDYALWKRKNSSPYRNIKEIIAMEEQYEAKSTFFFLATERDIKRERYAIEVVEHELGYILERGFEVGLHGGYYAYKELDEITAEKRRLENVLGKKCIGYRNHYLRFLVPETWEYLVKAGFKYDTTLGFNDAVGYRNGMCHPFTPFNLHSQKTIDILEIPLVIMDSALLTYATSSFEQAWNIAREMVDITVKLRGVLTVLWHNTSFARPDRKEWRKIYEKILAYGAEKNAWLTSGEEIYNWWSHDG